MRPVRQHEFVDCHFDRDPAAALVCRGGNGANAISVAAQGSGLTYQWRKDGVNLDDKNCATSQGFICGAFTPTLTFTYGLATPVVGTFNFDVLITNACGSVTQSSAATVTIRSVSAPCP